MKNAWRFDVFGSRKSRNLHDLAHSMVYFRISLVLAFVLLFRLSKFPRPFVVGCEDLVGFLWSVSILGLDDFQFHFSRWREPDVKFVLDIILEKPDPVNWKQVLLLLSASEDHAA